jgi:two-component system response regulator AtoC
VLLAAADVIESKNLPSKVRSKEINTGQEFELTEKINLGIENLAGLTLQEAEKKLIKAALEINNGHRKATAAMLGISERGLRYKISEYELE